ncbi:MAG: HD domain-containing protein [Lentisphaerae bacterium]|jgi:uncharacterized protein|nr:HD domain-containing protein [Lentisphaerota bacterium]
MTENKLQELLPALEAKVREIFATMPSCHDYDHTLRVRQNGAILARAEKADALLVDYAALLHDIGRQQELQDQGRTCHAALGAAMVRQILTGLGVQDEQFIQAVTDCVSTHRFRARGGVKPASLEAKVVFDADKLDSLGAIGLARSFNFAGRIGARVHNTREQALGAESYSREDSAYREFLVKLQYLPAKMLTASGRRLAAQRYQFMEDFFVRLEQECSGLDLQSPGPGI